MSSEDHNRLRALFAQADRRQARYLRRILEPSDLILREIDRLHAEARWGRVLRRWGAK